MMRWTVVTLLVLTVTFLVGCVDGDSKNTCVEHHSSTIITGYTNRLITTSTGRVVNEAVPILTTYDVCDRYMRVG